MVKNIIFDVMFANFLFALFSSGLWAMLRFPVRIQNLKGTDIIDNVKLALSMGKISWNDSVRTCI